MHSDDRALIVRARQGEAEAFGELVRRYQTTVFNVCYRLLAERREAEDLTQEAFLRAYGRLGSFDLERPFGPWMRRVAANLCLNRLAGRAPAAAPLEDELDADPQPGHDPEARRERRETVQAVRAALAGLPPHYRAVIELRHFHEMSYAEIAAELKIPLSDVKSHLFRARRILAEKLKTDD